MTRPGNSFRDRRPQAAAEVAYRVGDGCGVEVIPAAFGWKEALAGATACPAIRPSRRGPALSRRPPLLPAGRSPRAQGAFEADWTTKRTTTDLALSAYEAVEELRA